MSDPIILGNFEAVHELTENDNFHTSIYESDYDGLLIARCNQNGRHPHQITAILNGLNAKQASAELVAQYADRISQQDAELERLREALKPFALAATIFEQEYGDRMKSDTGCNIKFAVLCQARDALRAKAEEAKP